MASGGLKVGTCPTGVFRNIFFSSSLFQLLLFFFCLVFCNFNLAAKYSCSVLSMTASPSLGLSPRVTKTSYSLCLSLSVSPRLPQSDFLSCTLSVCVCVYVYIKTPINSQLLCFMRYPCHVESPRKKKNAHMEYVHV